MSREFRDNRGKTLADYVRPSVAVDTAVLSVDPDKGLVVLHVHRDTAVGWALPRTCLWEGETLADAAQRCLPTADYFDLKSQPTPSSLRFLRMALSVSVATGLDCRNSNARSGFR